MKLRLHLQMDERGHGTHLLVYNGTALVGELPAKTVLVGVSVGMEDPELTIRVGSRNYTIEVWDDRRGKVLYFENEARYREASAEDLQQADLVGVVVTLPTTEGVAPAKVVRVVKDRYGKEGQTVSVEGWQKFAEMAEARRR